MDTLRNQIDVLKASYPNAKVLGHRDFPKVAKACPCFDAGKWYETDIQKGNQMNDKVKETVGSVATKSTSGAVLFATALESFLNSEFMMKFAGKKTYLMAIIVKLSAVLGLFLGDLSFAEFLTTVGIGGGMATLKHGQKTIDAENDKEV